MRLFRWIGGLARLPARFGCAAAFGFWLLVSLLTWTPIAKLLSAANDTQNFVGAVGFILWCAFTLAVLLTLDHVYFKKMRG